MRSSKRLNRWVSSGLQGKFCFNIVIQHYRIFNRLLHGYCSLFHLSTGLFPVCRNTNRAIWIIILAGGLYIRKGLNTRYLSATTCSAKAYQHSPQDNFRSISGVQSAVIIWPSSWSILVWLQSRNVEQIIWLSQLLLSSLMLEKTSDTGIRRPIPN